MRDRGSDRVPRDPFTRNLTIAFVFGVLATCLGAPFLIVNAAFAPSVEEVGRYPSPDRKLIASVESTDGGATTSVGFHVYLQRASGWFRPRSEVALVYGATVGDRYGVKVQWDTPARLVVAYDRARWSEVRYRSRTFDGRPFTLRLVGNDEEYQRRD